MLAPTSTPPRRPGAESAPVVAPNPRKAVLLALCGFVLLSVGDTIVKTMAREWPGTAIAALRYTIGAAGLCALVGWFHGRSGFAYPKPALQIGRGAAVAAATLGFFLGVHLMPLADATSITFMSPLITVLLSAIFLRERTSRGALTAIVLAFAGVLIVLRPNLADLGFAALLPLASAVSMATLMLLNRRAAGLASAMSLQMIIAVTATPILIAATLAGHLSGVPALRVSVPDWTVVARCAVVAVTATSAHWLIFRATELASAATIAPMTYVQLVVAVGAGALLFGNMPDAVSAVGMAMIVAGGLWLWRGQRRRS